MNGGSPYIITTSLNSVEEEEGKVGLGLQIDASREEEQSHISLLLLLRPHYIIPKSFFFLKVPFRYNKWMEHDDIIPYLLSTCQGKAYKSDRDFHD